MMESLSKVGEIVPTSYVEKVGDVYLVERNTDGSWIAYCSKFGVWKKDLSNNVLWPARKRGSLSSNRWPERAFSEVGKTFWDNLTILDIEFRPRTKPYKGSTRVVNDAYAYCYCAKTNNKGWIALESVRSGWTKTLSFFTPVENKDSGKVKATRIVKHHPDFKCSPEHENFFSNLSVSKTTAGYAVITFEGRTKYAHHAVWELLGNEKLNTQGGECLDHINRDPMDNRIENLRLASMKRRPDIPLNGQNKPGQNKTSNHKGVCFHNGVWHGEAKVSEARYRKTFKDELSAVQFVFDVYEEANKKGHIFSGHTNPIDYVPSPLAISQTQSILQNS